jgi:HSP20 family protein
MNIIRRNPSALSGYRPRAMEDPFGRLVENMFEEMFSPFASGSALSQWNPQGAISPRLDVSETDQAFEIQAEMPGVKKEDVKVAIDRQRVTIEGEARSESEQRDGENLLYSERSASRFARSFTLPADVDEAGAEAHMEHGVLKLWLPKKQGSAAKRISVQ